MITCTSKSVSCVATSTCTCKVSIRVVTEAVSVTWVTGALIYI